MRIHGFHWPPSLFDLVSKAGPGAEVCTAIQAISQVNKAGLQALKAFTQSQRESIPQILLKSLEISQAALKNNT